MCFAMTQSVARAQSESFNSVMNLGTVSWSSPGGRP